MQILPAKGKNMLGACPASMLIGGNMPEWDSLSVEDFFYGVMSVPEYRKIALARGWTHMAMGKAGEGDNTYVIQGFGQCTDVVVQATCHTVCRMCGL
jgi:hypothetical protein